MSGEPLSGQVEDPVRTTPSAGADTSALSTSVMDPWELVARLLHTLPSSVASRRAALRASEDSLPKEGRGSGAFLCPAAAGAAGARELGCASPTSG